MAKASSQRAASDLVFALEVVLIDSHWPKSLDGRDEPDISRTIRIRAYQALAELHMAIFMAFDRHDPHLYEFRTGAKKPHDRQALRYTERKAIAEMSCDFAGATEKARLCDLGLRAGMIFFYLFDFGDMWWHKITVLAIDKDSSDARYPMIVARKGASPPQYEDGTERGGNFNEN